MTPYFTTNIRLPLTESDSLIHYLQNPSNHNIGKLLELVDPISKKGKVAFERIVRKDLGKGCRKTTGCAHRCRGAFKKPQPHRLLDHVGIKRHYERSSVDEIRPKPDINRRIVTHHPPQKHAYALAGGLRVFGNDILRPSRRKIPANRIDRSISITCSPALHILTKRSRFVK